MVRNAAALLILAFFAGPAWANTPVVHEQATIAGSIEMDLEKPVGPIRAGLICLPKGRARGHDFVSGDTEFSAILQDELSDSEEYRGKVAQYGRDGITIELRNIEVSLCARHWGVFGTGDTKSFDGRAQFLFRSYPRNSIGKQLETAVALELQRDSPMGARAIFRTAIQSLLGRLTF